MTKEQIEQGKVLLLDMANIEKVVTRINVVLQDESEYAYTSNQQGDSIPIPRILAKRMFQDLLKYYQHAYKVTLEAFNNL